MKSSAALCYWFAFAVIALQDICLAQYQMRLAGGTNSLEGRVEVYMIDDYAWGTVCDDFWDNNDAKVVCRQLGYPYATAESRKDAYFGQGSGNIVLDNVGCTGSETSLDHCSHDGWGVSHQCSHTEDAGVICGGECYSDLFTFRTGTNYDYQWQYLQPYASSFNFKVKAANDVHIGLSASNGVLPTFYEIVIGGWSDTKSIIRQGSQVDFPDFPVQSTHDLLDPAAFREFIISWAGGRIAVFKPGESSPFMEYTHSNPFPINYIGFTTGWESTGEFKFCTFEDGALDMLIGQGQLRLVGGDASSGRVEVFHNDVWGTICDDLWDDDAARVVCRQLGLPHANAQAHVYSDNQRAPFGEGSGRIWLDDIGCQGTETFLDQCVYDPWGQENCGHHEDAGVSCA